MPQTSGHGARDEPPPAGPAPSPPHMTSFPATRRSALRASALRASALLLLGGALSAGGCEPREADATAARADAAPAPADPAAQDIALQDTARTALIARADLGRIKGAESAKVWLIVISDFQCPFCKRWHEETAERIDREYVSTGKVRVAYMNYPISSHRNARPAHDVAMCAAEQGKFWPVADALFATQERWKDRGDAPAYFDSLARTLPLDHPRLRACVADGALRPLIQADLERSLQRGIGSTPTFFAGSRVIVGAQPFAAFKDALDRELAALPAAPR